LKLISNTQKSFKNGKGSLFILLSMFSILIPTLYKAFHLYFAGSALTIIFSAVLDIPGFILAANFLYFGFKSYYRYNHENNENTDSPDYFSFLFLSFILGIFYLLLVKIAFPMMDGFLISDIIKIYKYPLFILGFILSNAILFGVIIIIRSLHYVVSGAHPESNGLQLLLQSLSDTLKSKFTQKIILAGGLPLILIMFLSNKVDSIVYNSSLDGIFSVFISGIIQVILYAVGIIFFFGYLFEYMNKEQKENAGSEKIKHGALKYLLVLGSLAILFILSISKMPSTDIILDIIDNEESRATELNNSGKSHLAGQLYKNVYMERNYLKLYLDMELALNEEKMTDENKNKIRNEFNNYGNTSFRNNPGNKILYYILSQREKSNNNQQNYIINLEHAVKLGLDSPEFIMELMTAYKDASDDDKVQNYANMLIKSKSFLKVDNLLNLSNGRKKSIIKKQAKHLEDNKDFLSLTALNYYENKLYQEAMNELDVLIAMFPDNLSINYLIAMTDLELKEDRKPYTKALEAADRILKQYPDDEWAKELKAGIALRAGNRDALISSLKSAYDANPDDHEIAEQYAYSLIKQNTSFSLSEADIKAYDIFSKILSEDEERWFSLYSLSVLELKKANFTASLDYLKRFLDTVIDLDEVFTYYDDFYYLYAQKYSELCKRGNDAIKVLEEKKDDDETTYNYIYSIFYWDTKDYQSGLENINKLIGAVDNLSKPYYVRGNIYFENAFINNVPDNYEKAIENYNKALTIFEEDPYTLYSLGHVYKKMGNLEEALATFKRALYYMPKEDHAVDHFGVSIHSTYQIDEITRTLKERQEVK
jgi:tetratricopeptide (TPR) repeat protein